MRIPPWTPERKPQNPELVEAIRARRGGELLNLDRALLWSEPVARGWNVYLKAVRTELPTSRKLREWAICTVALLTGAHYEYHHHAPDYLAHGGTKDELDALRQAIEQKAHLAPVGNHFSAIENAVFHYAAQMTLNVRVDDAVFAAMREHFDETQIVEITSAIATYNMVARFLVALQIQPEA